MRKIKTFSTGSSRSRLYTYARLVKYFSRNTEFAKHDYHHVFLRAKDVLEKYLDLPLPNARILEVGCGQRFAVTLLFHSLGAKVTGIDTDIVYPRLTLRVLARIAKHNGLERCLKTLARRIMFDRQYYRVLHSEAQIPLMFRGMDIRHMSATSMEFPGEDFDYVYSNAVFEHVDDPDRAAAEIQRVLKPAGVCNIGIHLFPSLSGGAQLGMGVPGRGAK